MVNYTSSLPEETIEKLNEMARRFQVPKNEIINKALVNYLEALEKRMFIDSFKKLAGDKEMLAIAEEGFADYLDQISDYEKG